MQDSKSGSKEYLKTKIMTASPEELYLLLYDGAIKFAEEAKEHLANKNYEKACNCLIRAQNIVLEMNTSLDHENNPDLCKKLSSLYNFIYYKLVQANLKHTIEDIDDALKILYYQRETWIMYMDKVRSLQCDEGKQVFSELDDKEDNIEDKSSDNLSDMIGGKLSISV